MIEIKSRFNGAVLFRCETATTITAALLAAIASRANLSGANLYGANLYGANLSRANLSRANLYGANLYGANLSRANLSRANLYGADLSGADLYGANLSGADLYGANLSGANLSGADLSRANVSELRGVVAVAVTWPGHGECGRQLLAIRDDKGTVYHCGFFRGSRNELLAYIKEGPGNHKPSRTLTLDVVDMLLAASERAKAGS